MVVYHRRAINSLMDLRPGEHIQIDNIPPSRDRTRSSSWSFSSSSNATPLRNGHHMLVVRPLSTENVLVIHMTESGVREEDVSLDAKNVVVLEHECRHIGEDAIRNARDCFDTIMIRSSATTNSSSIMLEA